MRIWGLASYDVQHQVITELGKRLANPTAAAIMQELRAGQLLLTALQTIFWVRDWTRTDIRSDVCPSRILVTFLLYHRLSPTFRTPFVQGPQITHTGRHYTCAQCSETLCARCLPIELSRHVRPAPPCVIWRDFSVRGIRRLGT